MAEKHWNKKELRCVKCQGHIAGGYQKVSSQRGICASCLRREYEEKQRRAGQK